MRESIKEQLERVASALASAQLEDVAKKTPITTRLRNRPLGIAKGYIDGRPD